MKRPDSLLDEKGLAWAALYHACRRGLRVTYTKCKEDDKMARHIVIGTAGHVDHGKTTLVRALTGIETDTTAEEKKRGLTINLGFAWLDLPDGTRAGIVDVPGHEKFIKNMVAGLPGLNLVLLVVDANEGVMPQTKEHLDILTLLGVHRFIIVVTKADTVDETLLGLALQDIRQNLADTAAEDALSSSLMPSAAAG